MRSVAADKAPAVTTVHEHVIEFVSDSGEGAQTEIFLVDEALHRQRAERLRALRERRDNAAVERTLAALEEDARGEGNLLPRIVDAVEAYATLGEISDRLRTVYGIYRESFAV